MDAQIAEFDFELLEPPAPSVEPPSAEDVMDILAAARAEADAVREAARAEGFAAGHADALASLAPALAALDGAVAELRAAQEATAAELERRSVDFALALASKVVAGTLSAEPERVVDVVTGALRGLVERERVTVLVNPEDLEIVREAGESLRATLGGISHFVVEAERRVGRGGCVVRTAVGDLDARVETKLERAADVIARALSES